MFSISRAQTRTRAVRDRPFTLGRFSTRRQLEVVVFVRRAPFVAAALFALVLTGCDSGSDTGSAAPAGPTVNAPGKPGVANQTLSAHDAD
jgi:hypothetical protein